MSEIVCPHCGSSNPIEADKCSVCHKSLYEEPSQPFRSADGDEMQWLKDYRSFGSDDSFLSDQESEDDLENGGAESEPWIGYEAGSRPVFDDEAESDNASGDEPEIPEWLARIRARSREDAKAFGEETTPPEEEPKFKVGEPIKTDWLKDLTGEEDKPAATDESKDFPAWLKRISTRNLESQEAKAEEKTESVSPFDFSADSGGIESTDTSEPAKGETPKPFFAEEEETSFPFTSSEEKAASTFESVPESEGDADLFNLYSQELESLAVPPTEGSEPGEDEKSEFPTDLSALEEEVSKGREGLPSFITEGLPEEPAADEIEPLEDIEPIPDIDWLNERYTAPPVPETPAEEPSKIIDWTSDETEESSEQPWNALSEIDRWQADKDESSPSSADALSNLERMLAEDQEPIFKPEDIISNLDSLEDQSEGIADFIEEDAATSDWLKPEKEEPTDFQQPKKQEQPAQAADWPDWLLESEESQADAETQAEKLPSPPSSRIDLPEEPSLYTEENLPDWIKEESPGASEPPPVESVPSPEKENVPDWLQELSPGASRKPGKSAPAVEEPIEESGPLAGFQGILPGGNSVSHYTKTPVYSGTLQVTEKQRIYATMFDTLISNEKKVEETIEGRAAASPQVLRLFAGFLTIGILAIALFFDAHLTTLPVLYPAENVAFYNEIKALTDTTASPHILVGMDYEPALSGEVGNVATYVLQDLMVGNSSLAFVSLNPTGPALAEDLVRRSNKAVPEYTASEKVANLGYLPGGASALAGLAASLPDLAPAIANGNSAWDSGPMQGVRSINDFDAVILLTDNTESARAWIEQIQTPSQDTPFLLVSSAQAVPALQPYVHSGQVTGLLGGLSGAASYQKLAGVPSGTLTRYWDAYQIGMLLAAIFMILGAAIYGTIQLIEKFKKV